MQLFIFGSMCALFPAELYYIFQSVSLLVKMVLKSNAALQHSSGVFHGDITC